MDAFVSTDPLGDESRRRICEEIKNVCTQTHETIRHFNTMYRIILALLIFGAVVGLFGSSGNEPIPWSHTILLAAFFAGLLIPFVWFGQRRKKIVFECYYGILFNIPKTFAGRLLLFAEANEPELREKAEAMLKEIAEAALWFSWDPYRQQDPTRHVLRLIKAHCGSKDGPPDGAMMLR
jgi:hypothetical protein